MRRRAPQSELGTALRERFAHNVRELRTQRKMTQAQLAESAGVGRSFINQIERGHFSVTLETIAALAQALGVSPLSLIGTTADTMEANEAPWSTPARVRRRAGRRD